MAVSYALLGRLIRGVYADLGRDEMLGLPIPQDIVWHLGDGAPRSIHR